MEGAPLEFITIQPQKGGLLLNFINQKGGPPLGTISMDLAVHRQIYSYTVHIVTQNYIAEILTVFYVGSEF